MFNRSFGRLFQGIILFHPSVFILKVRLLMLVFSLVFRINLNIRLIIEGRFFDFVDGLI